jgi:hypothetical protein
LTQQNELQDEKISLVEEQTSKRWMEDVDNERETITPVDHHEYFADVSHLK